MNVLECPHCARQFRALPDVLGRTILCRGCRQPFRVPAGEPAQRDRPASIATAAEGVFAGMSVRSCPMCGHTFSMQPRLAGKTIRCRKCRSRFRVLHEAERAPPAEGAIRAEPARPAAGQSPPDHGLKETPTASHDARDDAGDLVEEQVVAEGGASDGSMWPPEAVASSWRPHAGGAHDGGIGMLIAVLVGGLLAFPVSQIVCWWGMRWDPFGVARKLRPELRWLAPADLVTDSPDRE